MKKILLVLLFTLVSFSTASADMSGTKLTYYSPKEGIFDSDTVTLKWRILSHDTVKNITLVVTGIQDGSGATYNKKITFDGDDGKKKTYTLTDLPQKASFAWNLLIETTEGTGSFGFAGVLATFSTK